MLWPPAAPSLILWGGSPNGDRPGGHQIYPDPLVKLDRLRGLGTKEVAGAVRGGVTVKQEE
jgi:hypothetical protein